MSRQGDEGAIFAHNILSTSELLAALPREGGTACWLRRCLAALLHKREQIGVDLVRVGRGHAMREARIDLQSGIL